MMNRARWSQLLAEAPFWNEESAEEFGKLGLEWAYARLHAFYGARYETDLHLREELAEVVARFFAGLARTGCACLEHVPVGRREAYLWKALYRLLCRNFERVNRYRENHPSLEEIGRGNGGDRYRYDTTFGSIAADPQEIALEHVERSQLLRFAATLPPPRPEIFHLHFVHEETAQAVARRLDLPLGTVNWHIREIRLAFKRRFPHGEA